MGLNSFNDRHFYASIWKTRSNCRIPRPTEQRGYAATELRGLLLRVNPGQFNFYNGYNSQFSRIDQFEIKVFSSKTAQIATKRNLLETREKLLKNY